MQALSEVEFDGERVVPGKTPVYLIWAHAARYQFIREMVTDRVVLDAGSGEGYGTSFLAHRAKSAVGIDLSPEMAAHSERRYGRANLKFAGMDCCKLAFASASFDFICSFEVIEHFTAADDFLREVHRVLKPGGVFVVSTPNRERTPEGVNRFHEQEYTADEFRGILGKHFSSVDCYGQVCERPLREALFMKSTQLYVQNPLYRRMLNSISSLYFRGQRADSGSTDPDWVDRMNPGAFRFDKVDARRGTYLVGVCKKQSLSY